MSVMEMAKFTTKSLLKKPGTIELNKSKKVTFNNTVKVFIDERNKNSKIDSVADLESKFIEISIVDKSKDTLNTDSLEDCKATDFLVHKVIYDNYVLPENDEDLDFRHDPTEDQPVLFESGQDDEGLDFVVHKVTEHEDDLIKKDSDFNLENEENENVPTLDVEENNTVTKFSMLSIENILEHDKIIAFIDQRSLGLKNTSMIESVSNTGFLESNDFFSNNSSEKLTNNLVLSPPLQELSLEKIVKAHSNNILCELDISPLNSVQETDSDSDISSEGTMIMMTSEECQKNEQHIRESLMQYQTMKEKVAQAEPGSQPSVSDSENLNVESQSEAVATEGTLQAHERLSTEQETALVTNSSAIQESTNLQKVDSKETNASDDSSSNSLPNELPFKRTYSSSLPDADVLYAKDNHLQTKHQNMLKRASSENGTQFKGKYLTSVEIPSDVREWKILSNSLEKSSSGDSSHNQHNGDCMEQLPKEHLYVQNRPSEEYLDLHKECPSGYFAYNGQSQKHNGQLKDYADVPIQKSNPQENFHLHMNGYSSDHNKPKSDELENFVYESNERVERIRKRYHLSGRQHSRHGILRQSPVRGIRPRFGSTAEILQLMQKQNNPPFITYSGSKNHMSWPCEETSSSPELERTRDHYYMSQSLSSQCSSQSSIDSYCEDPLNTSCDHYSISSCPSIMVNERGVPEGASPPNSVLGSEAPCTSENPNGFVYFSMKV